MDLEGFDFTDLSRELAAKRPLDEVDRGPSQTPEAKRAKTEVQADEESLEKSLALLVQNALADVGDLVDHFNAESDEPLTATTEPMDTARPLPAFSADPQAYVREMNINALGGMVRPTPMSDVPADGTADETLHYRPSRCCTYWSSSPSTRPWP